MKTAKETVRWFLLLLGIAYRAWLAGGPPTPNPEGWLSSASNYLSWSLACLSVGVGVFLLMGRFPWLSKMAIKFLATAMVLAILPAAREFLAVESCLDARGKWLYEELRCVYE